MRVLVTGGAGFIGSAVCRHLVSDLGHEVVNVDALTYAASLSSLDPIAGSNLYTFVRADIRDRAAMDAVLAAHRPDAVMHLAAESHVDRSIDGPGTFVETNVLGTFQLLEAARAYWLREGRPGGFRFHHVSTDEVFGSLGPEGQFTEDTPYDPRSPYSATKAASDHLVRAAGQKHGDGAELDTDALLTVLERGAVGRSYNIGGENEARNIDLVHTICRLLDERRPQGAPHARLIAFVQDRPGHDARYAIDPTRLREELGWRPSVTLEEGLRRTVDWYLQNEDWWRPLLARHGVGQRLGTTAEPVAG